MKIMHKMALISLLLVLSPPADAETTNAPVVIDYFYVPGCPDCNKVRDIIMPAVEERFYGFYVLNKYDIRVESNVLRLAVYHDRLGITKNEDVCMVLDYKHALNGYSAVKEGIIRQIDESIAARMDPDWSGLQPIIVPETADGGIGVMERRVENFTLPMVLIGGLADGINPCAIGALVFLMSLLGVSGVRGHRLLVMGASFCFAVFVTYTAIGWGLLKVLHKTMAFETARKAVEWILTGILCVLAILSFRDAWRYGRSGRAGDVTLQLPDRLKRLVHSIMRKEIRARSLVAGGLFSGATVTVLEAVCTGQVYVPVLVAVAGSRSAQAGRALGYLLVYNVMFILPLVFVFVLTFFGALATS